MVVCRSGRISRRRFLVGAGIALAGAVLGCGQGQEAARLITAGPAPSPTSGATSAPANTLAPIATGIPSPTATPRPSPPLAEAAASPAPAPDLAAPADMVLVNGKTIELEGIVVLAEKLDKVFLPNQAIDVIKAELK